MQGLQGSNGTQGLQGFKGNQGLQGRQGIKGSQGIQGTEGDVTLIEAASVTTGEFYPVMVSDSGSPFTASIDKAAGHFRFNASTGVLTTTATQARYADLAENYVADADYETGTVLIIGGEKEVTQSTKEFDLPIAGVVSEKPSYLMNCELNGTHIATVALRGRVPVKVVGKVEKGDTLIASELPGVAKSTKDVVNNVIIIGIALENKDTDDEGLVEILV